jgi:DMSO reductase anchor subunit
MTSLIQLSAGTLITALLSHHDGLIAVTLILALTAFTLSISILHLGRPAYAWRALKMWRRSWLSREVLLFGLFFCALIALTTATWLSALHIFFVPVVLAFLKVLTPALGVAGILASAYIYLVPARPAWNTPHTPADFLLSSALLGSAAAPLLIGIVAAIDSLPRLRTPTLHPATSGFPLWPVILSSTLWMLNHVVRTVRLHHASIYERRASASLLNTYSLRGVFLVSFAFVGLSILLSLVGLPMLALAPALAGVVSSRYLFFVSVVPLNMALTFVRSVHA